MIRKVGGKADVEDLGFVAEGSVTVIFMREDNVIVNIKESPLPSEERWQAKS